MQTNDFTFFGVTNIMELDKKWEKVGYMYFGTFLHSFDSKGRLVVPSQFRNGNQQKFYVLRGYEKTLEVYPESAFIKLAETVAHLSFNHRDEREFMRVRLASVIECEIDDHGRVAIPLKILSLYDLAKDVAVIGVNDHFEIWDRTRWHEYETEASNHLEDLADTLPDKSYE